MVEARAGIEPAIELLQSPALPLGYLAFTKKKHPLWRTGVRVIKSHYYRMSMGLNFSDEISYIIIPGATVSFGWVSIKIKLPVTRFLR